MWKYPVGSTESTALKVMRRGVVVCCLLSLIHLTPVFSQDTEEEAEGPGITMDTMVITVDRTESDFKTGDVDNEQTPAFFTVISRDAFEGKMEDLSEVIEKEAGIQVRQSGGLGSFSTMSLRGSTGEQVMIYMDGVLLNDASGGGVDLSNIALSDIQSIEIYRGVSPVNFGRASIGGVVNIKTFRSKKEFKANASVGFGSFGTRRLSAFVNHKPGDWDYLISADYSASDNDFEFLNDNGTEWNAADDRWEDRNNAAFDQTDVLVKAGYDYTKDFRIDFVNQYFSKNQEMPSWNNSPNTDTTFDTTRNITTLKMTADDFTRYHLNTMVGLDYSNKTEEYDDHGGHVGLGQQHSEYQTKRIGLNGFAEWFSDTHTVSGTFDIRHENYDPEDMMNKQTPHDSTRDQYSIGIQDAMLLLDGKMTLTPAIRYTLIKDELDSAVSAFGVPLEGKSRDEDYFMPQLGAKYQALNWLTLKSNISQYVREPSFFELFGDRGFFMGNEELDAEEGTNFDLGFEAVLPVKIDRIDRLGFSAAYFRSDVDNLISRVYDSRGIGKAENIAESSVSGIEASVNIDFMEYFRFSGNLTFQDTENKNPIAAFNGKSLPGRFEKSYFARLEGNYRGFKAYAEYVAERDMYYDTANLLKADDKEEINVGISKLYKMFLLSFDIKNLTDDQYEEFNGYPMPGTAYYATLKYTY